MEILMTFLAEVDCAFNERPKSVLEQLDPLTNRTSSLQDLRSTTTLDPQQQQQKVGVVATPELVAESMDTINAIGNLSQQHQQQQQQHIRSHSYDVDHSHSTRLRVQGFEEKRKDRRLYSHPLIKFLFWYLILGLKGGLKKHSYDEGCSLLLK